MKTRQQIAQVSDEVNIALAVVSLNGARVNAEYRITLTQASLAAALTFDPKELTQEDKTLKLEVVLHSDSETADMVNAQLAALRLDETYELAWPSAPTTLPARLSRVLPSTPSLSVKWSETLKAPTPGRSKVLLVAVEEVRFVASPGVSAAEPTDESLTEPASAQHEDGWFAGDQSPVPSEAEAEARANAQLPGDAYPADDVQASPS